MKNWLLPNRFKLLGFILTFLGVIMSVFYVWFDFRFTLPVFAVYSSFLETKLFEVIKTNVADELTLLPLLGGLSLLAFTKEKVETALIENIRLRAFISSGLINSFLILFSIVFVYGSGFIGVLVFNIISFQLLYLITFFFLKLRNKQMQEIN